MGRGGARAASPEPRGRAQPKGSQGAWVPEPHLLFPAFRSSKSNLSLHQAEPWRHRVPGPCRPFALAIPGPATPASPTVALGLAPRPPPALSPISYSQRRPPWAPHLLPAPRPAYPPARLFGCAGGGQAGRRGRLLSLWPQHVLPTQGPPGAGPLPVVIPGRAQTRVRARTCSRPTLPGAGQP